MEGQESRVSKSGDRARRDQGRREEGKKSIGLADTQVCQGCAEVPRIGKLLSLIHQGLHIHSYAIT